MTLRSACAQEQCWRSSGRQRESLPFSASSIAWTNPRAGQCGWKASTTARFRDGNSAASGWSRRLLISLRKRLATNYASTRGLGGQQNAREKAIAFCYFKILTDRSVCRCLKGWGGRRDLKPTRNVVSTTYEAADGSFTRY